MDAPSSTPAASGRRGTAPAPGLPRTHVPDLDIVPRWAFLPPKERAEFLRERTRARRAYFPVEHREATEASYRAWREPRPWRWLPRPLRPVLFGLLGRGFADRFVADWKTRYRREHGSTLELILHPAEFTVHSARDRRAMEEAEAAADELFALVDVPPAGDPHAGIRLTSGGFLCRST